jgi:RNA 2',3'-cyclic 3'-phosphodiesterase
MQLMERYRMGKRVFVAMPVSEELCRSAALIRKRYPHYDIRWVNPEQLHITLLPPWQCSDTADVCQRVQEVAAHHAPIAVTFDILSAGPSRRKPRLVWITGKAPERLCELQRELRSTLGCSAEESEREFLLHLTLARFRAGGKAASALAAVREPVEWSETLTTLTLYESVLRPEGAEYRVLCSYKLPIV